MHPRLPAGYDKETGKARGFAHVEFATPAEAARAAETMHGADVDGRNIKCEVAAPRNNAVSNRNPTETLTVFVRGFDTSLGEDAVRAALQDAFGACGEVTRISLPSDR